MKRTLVVSLTLTLGLWAAVALAGNLDLQLKMLLASPEVGKAMLGKAVAIRGGGGEDVDVIIKSLDPELTAAEIEAAGGTVRSIIGEIMTAFVPISYLEGLALREEVMGIEPSKELNLLMDSARQNTGADSVQTGAADGTARDGTDVVVGVIDTGIDYSREDFKDAEGATRVQYMRFQSVSGSTVYYTQCAKDYIDDGTCSSAIPASNDSVLGHGSHVTGIAAGDGGGTDYIGIAPAADIMVVRNTFISDLEEGTGTLSGGVLDGVVEIFKKADILDKPAVINLSQGTHIGAHDNTSLMEQGINNAIEGEYTSGGNGHGRVMVAAAGNEHIVEDALGVIANNAGGVHAVFSVPDGSNHAWRLWALATPVRSPVIVDTWFGTGEASRCSVAAKVYPYSQFTATDTGSAAAAVSDMPLSTENSGTQATSNDNKVLAVIATDPEDSQNSKPRALFGFGPASSGSWNDIKTSDSNDDGTPDAGYFLDVIIRASGGSCSGDMWIEGGSTYLHFLKGIDTLVTVSGTGNYSLQDGDNSKSVAIPATASGAISVGAYLQEKPYGSGASGWTDTEGTHHDATDIAGEPAAAEVNGGTVGTRCPFSSIGPTADGRQKPDILAPGDPVISVLPTGYSADDDVVADSTHYKAQGTSQATPVVSGIIALMLQKNNTLTASQVKSTLTSTADSSYQGYDSTKDGYGKVRAAAAIAAISADSSGYSGTGDLTQDDITDDNGGTSSSAAGCGKTIVPSPPTQTAAPALLVLVPAVIMTLKRRFGRR